jgi:superoxide dismutase, Fe-Mn family
MAFALPELPYDKTALEPHMSAETFDYHHGKHHKAYVDKTNGWIGEKGLEGLTLIEVIEKAKRDGDKGLFNNAAQIWNHSFFWQCLAPAGSTSPSAALQAKIDEAFGSTQELLTKLKEESIGHFASGWGWLVLKDGKLAVTSLHDADTPVVYPEFKPLLTLDVWEHAYYVDYRNARPDYLEAVLKNIVNWDFVEQNLDGEGASRADQSQ